MCGSEEQLYVADIEGTRLNVCRKCANFGKIITPIRTAPAIKKHKKIIKKEEEPEPEIIRMVARDFSRKIRNAREKLGLKQKEFAKNIKEKESVVHKMETGELAPSLKLAEKLEKILGIKLIEEYEEKHEKKAATKAENLTIGDMIKIKRK